jgi:hypothetical protein
LQQRKTKNYFKGITMNAGKVSVTIFAMVCVAFLFVNASYSQSDVALNKPAKANSWDSTGFGANGKGMPATLANDGDQGTRWASDWMTDSDKDSGWIYIDFLGQYTIDSVVIKWEAAGALHYSIQVANVTDTVSQASLDSLASDAAWTTVADITDGTGAETRTITFTPTLARQLRVRGFSRTTTFGYSIWDMQCFDPTLSAVLTGATPAARYSQVRTTVTPGAVRFSAPGITGCRLFDVLGRNILTVDQQTGPALTLDLSSPAFGAAGRVLFARLISKNGISTHRLTIAR